MRDLVPRKSPVRKNTVTPWSTYDHCTPIKLPKAKNRPSLSPSPVAHSKSPIPPSPLIGGNDDERGRDTPSFTEFPHESMQLPRRTIRGPPAKIRPPIDVFEDFISDMSPFAKEKVRSTYNGVDWPQSSNNPQRARQSMAAMSSISTTLLPVQPYITPQTSYLGGANRFLAGLPSFATHQAPQIVYHYFPRGC
jgi:hypothetical protein